MNKIILCGRRGGCCPVVEKIKNDEYQIIDDYGGFIRLTSEQIQMLRESNLDDMQIL